MEGLPGQGADLPHLIQHLKNEFVKHAAAKMGSEPTEMKSRAVEKWPAKEFWDFCADYLANNRTVENWPADRNIGLRLSNNTRVLVHPATRAGSGDMQDSGSVPITEGQTQPGQEGVSGTQANHVT